MLRLGDTLAIRRDALDPQQFQEEIFEHFSIPAFDAGRLPSSERGGQIRSQKYSVSDAHVLVAKLNPSTPRVWLPERGAQHRQIASTEFLACEPLVGRGHTRVTLYHIVSDTRATDYLAASGRTFGAPARRSWSRSFPTTSLPVGSGTRSRWRGSTTSK